MAFLITAAEIISFFLFWQVHILFKAFVKNNYLNFETKIVTKEWWKYLSGGSI